MILAAYAPSSRLRNEKETDAQRVGLPAVGNPDETKGLQFGNPNANASVPLLHIQCRARQEVASTPWLQPERNIRVDFNPAFRPHGKRMPPVTTIPQESKLVL